MTDEGKYISPLSYINHPVRIVKYQFTKKADGESPYLKVGKFCSIGAHCNFIFASHRLDTITTFPDNKEAVCKGDIMICNDVWVGTNATVMAGVTIHNGAVVGTGSMVTKDVEPYAIVAGNPAKFIRYRFNEEQRKALEELHIWDLPDEELKKVDLWETDVDKFVNNFRKKYRSSL